MTAPDTALARVLVIDPVPESAGLFELIFQKLGNKKVFRASSVDAAIKQIATHDPELILLDADLPDDMSLRFCRQISQHRKTGKIPVILFSDRRDRRHMLSAFEAGAVDYLFKPIFPMELVARTRTHLELKRQHDEIERKATEQKELVQVMCHDISGPVSACINLIEMSRDDSALLQECLSHVLVSLKKVTEMTDLVRKMRSFEEGKMEWTLAPIPLKAALDDTLSTLQQRMLEKGIAVNIAVDPDLHVLAEPVSLVNSVLANLLTNAIKFSHRNGAIDIEAKPRNETIVLSIQDHGIGMPPKIHENLFNINVPTSRPGTSNEPGTGFGMPLVKKFLKGYNGEIRVFSTEQREQAHESGTRIDLIFQRPSDTPQQSAASVA